MTRFIFHLSFQVMSYFTSLSLFVLLRHQEGLQIAFLWMYQALINKLNRVSFHNIHFTIVCSSWSMLTFYISNPVIVFWHPIPFWHPFILQINVTFTCHFSAKARFLESIVSHILICCNNFWNNTQFLATLVALDLTPVRNRVIVSD